MNILCDTSFLMVLVTKPIKLFDSIVIQYGKINFLIPDVVIEELKNLVHNPSYKSSLSAKTVLEKCGITQAYSVKQKVNELKSDRPEIPDLPDNIHEQQFPDLSKVIDDIIIPSDEIYYLPYELKKRKRRRRRN